MSLVILSVCNLGLWRYEMLMYNIMQLGYIKISKVNAYTSLIPSLQIFVACSYTAWA